MSVVAAVDKIQELGRTFKDVIYLIFSRVFFSSCVLLLLLVIIFWPSFVMKRVVVVTRTQP